MRLTGDERAFLDDAVSRRDEAAADEETRLAVEAFERSRARRRSFAVGVGAAALIAAAVLAFVLPMGQETLPTITSLTYADRDDNQFAELGEQGITRAEQESGSTSNAQTCSCLPRP